ERKREDSDDRKSGRFAQHAQAVTDILEEILEPIYAAHIGTLLTDLIDAAEFSESRAAGSIRRHSGCDVGGDLAFEVEAELLVQFTVDAFAAK
ncbi:MAG TPA: hypothetical protein VFW94_14435, partial [Candidatus Acidoferrales bacterium]|nr:hypothetical protein [Candidatus Acidoferrales bacterium]